MTDTQLLISDKNLNDLQKAFYSEFCNSFPDLKNKIKIEDGIISKENFCFTIQSGSEHFGSISFDIDNIEITVFTNFDHKHFPTYWYDSEKNIAKQIKLTCDAVIDFAKDYFTGDMIIELHLDINNNILKTRQYHKSDSNKPTSTAIYLGKSFFISNIVTKFKHLFGLNDSKKTIAIKRLNWYGEIE